MKTRVLLIAILFISTTTFASSYYWVGGSGNWTDYANHWATSSGGSTFASHVPFPNDHVFFDANSGNSGYSVTIDALNATCANMNWTDTPSGATLTGPASNKLSIFGSLTFVPAMNLTFQGTVSFEGNATNNTLTTAGKVFPGRLHFDGVGGAWSLNDDLNGSFILCIYNGTLTTNSKTVTTERFGLGYGSSQATLNMDASIFNITSGQMSWDVQQSSLTMLNAGTSIINIYNTSTTQFHGGSKTYYDVIFHEECEYFFEDNVFHKVVFSKGVPNWYGSNTFGELYFSPGYTYTLPSNKIQTVTTSFHCVGNGAQPIRIKASTSGSPASLYKSSGLVCLNYVQLSDNNATGGATFYLGYNFNSVDMGGNTGWIFNFCGAQVGINNNESANTGSVYPNPFSESATIKANEINLHSNLHLYNALGQEVKSSYSSGEKEMKIDRNGLEEGLYFYKIETDKKISAQGKLIISSK